MFSTYNVFPDQLNAFSRPKSKKMFMYKLFFYGVLGAFLIWLGKRIIPNVKSEN